MERSSVAFDQNFSGAADFPALLRRKGLLASPVILRYHRLEPRKRRGNRPRQQQFLHSNFQAASWWRVIAVQLLATPSSTIAQTKFWKSIDIRSWQSRVCPRRPGRWRAYWNIHSNIFGGLNCKR